VRPFELADVAGMTEAMRGASSPLERPTRAFADQAKGGAKAFR